MTDKKISELTSMTSAEIANDDEIVISDTSATHTKKAGIGELATFFGVNTEGIQDTVGAMFTGHSSHAGITPVYDDPNGHLIFSLAGGVTTAEMGFLAGTTSDIQTQFDAKAPLASPALTGNPTAPTQTADNNSTRLATTAYVQTELTDYASDNATFTNKGGAISQWTNDSGYITASSTDTLTNKSGNISQFTNDSNYLTSSSTNTLTNKSIDGASNPITNVPYTAISNIVDTDITSVSASDNELASSKAIKTYVDAQISGIDTIAEASDSNISSPSAGQILVHDGTDSFDNQTSTVTLSGAVTGTANMDSSGDFAITTTIPTNSITINGQSVALGGSATIPSVLQSGGTFTGELHLNDDVLLSFGGASGSGDFSISHDSSTNKTIFAEGGAGDLEIRASDFVVKNGANNKTMINAEDGGSVELYEDNTKVFETSATGVDVTGNIVVSGTVDGVDVASLNTTVGNLATVATSGLYSDLSGSPTLATVATSGAYSDLSGTPTIPSAIGGATGVDFNDNVKARFGTGNDLEIYHNGNDSIIADTGTGDLVLAGDNIQITNSAMTENKIIATSDGGVQLYHDNTKIVETTGNGLELPDNYEVRLGDSGDLIMYHDGSNSFIKDQGTGGLYLRGDTVIALGVGSESAVRCTINSDVKLYFDDAEKLATTSGGISVTGTITASGNITANSDQRLKSDIKTIDNALDKVCEMRGVTYTKDNELGSGVIAQEIEKVAPELVLDGEYKSVAYGNTVGYLIEAIKELKSEIEELKKDK